MENKASTESHREMWLLTSPTCLQVPTKACFCRKL